MSVVATVLNESAGIDALLDTVLAQAGPDDEMVVVLALAVGGRPLHRIRKG